MKVNKTFQKSGKSTPLRQQIIDASTDLFYEHGFEKASLRDIARKVGVTQAAIYYHFRNKEEILYTIIEINSNELLFTLKSCLLGNTDPLEKLRNTIFQHISLIKTSRKGAKIIIEDKRFLSGDLYRLVQEKEKTVYNLYKNQIEELQRARRINDFDLTAATFGILGMINWLYHWYRPEKRLSIEKLANEITNILFLGFMRQEVGGMAHHPTVGTNIAGKGGD